MSLQRCCKNYLKCICNCNCILQEHLSICLGFLPLAHSCRSLPARHTKCEEPWWLRVSIFLFQAFSMRFRLEHVRSKKGPAGARFSKVPVTERTPKAVLFSFPLPTNTDEWNATKFYDTWHFSMQETWVKIVAILHNKHCTLTWYRASNYFFQLRASIIFKNLFHWPV